ncbi:hypothetical protein [Thiolapillus sp.]|uniref:hypothetical protein n=1 Tax=Thiolapillus sp. TaxID=2017437 RepID=UPI0025D2E164
MNIGTTHGTFASRSILSDIFSDLGVFQQPANNTFGPEMNGVRTLRGDWQLTRRMRAYSGVLLALVLFGAGFPVYADNVISGTVFLPGGDVAQTGGQRVLVYVNDTGSDQSVSKSVVIPQGNSSQSYSINVPANGAAQWEVAYDLGLLANQSYVRVGYYAAAAGTTWDKSAATLLAGGADHGGIDLALLNGDRISGNVLLPSGEVAPAGGLSIGITIRDSVHGFYFGVAPIAAGASSATYKMVVPSLGAANWSVKYSCSGSGCEPYYLTGYYAASGTTWNFLDATLLPGGSDHDDVDLTLLHGDHFSGRLFLPAGEVAPAGGTRFDVSITNTHTNDRFQRIFTVLAGDAFVSYDMVVPYIPTAEWTVGYLCNSAACQSYVQKAYYLDGGMTLDESLATLFSSGADYDQVDLQVALNIPDSCGQADETLSGPVTYSGDYFCSAENSITAGQNSVVVGNGAYVVYAAPSISLVPGFSVADHGVFRAGKDLLP